jgi:hypothetical protein
MYETGFLSQKQLIVTSKNLLRLLSAIGTLYCIYNIVIMGGEVLEKNRICEIQNNRWRTSFSGMQS